MDHGKSIEVARAAVDAGYTSALIDTSRLPLEQNIAATREIVEHARSHGVQVEAELGQLAGIEDVGDVAAEATLTVPEEALRFVAETGVDSLAITIGTSHGAFKFAGAPRLDFARLADIASRIQIPLVLHGASAVNERAVALAEGYRARLPKARGLPDGLIDRAISMGIAKINTESDLRLAALGRLRQVLGRIRLFGRLGRARAGTSS